MLGAVSAGVNLICHRRFGSDPPQRGTGHRVGLDGSRPPSRRLLPRGLSRFQSFIDTFDTAIALSLGAVGISGTET